MHPVIPVALNRLGASRYYFGMAMTLRLPPELEAELRLVAEEQRRSVHQTVLVAIETYLALKETAEIRADPDTLRALAQARESVRNGDVHRGVDAVRRLVEERSVHEPAS